MVKKTGYKVPQATKAALFQKQMTQHFHMGKQFPRARPCRKQPDARQRHSRTGQSGMNVTIAKNEETVINTDIKQQHCRNPLDARYRKAKRERPASPHN